MARADPVVMSGHLFFASQEIPDPATGNKGTNFAHYRGIDDLLAQGRRERDQEKRAQLYHEAQQRIMRAAICVPIVEVSFLQPRNPKRVQAPFDPEYGEFSLLFNYNYPEMLKILDQCRTATPRQPGAGETVV